MLHYWKWDSIHAYAVNQFVEISRFCIRMKAIRSARIKFRLQRGIWNRDNGTFCVDQDFQQAAASTKEMKEHWKLTWHREWKKKGKICRAHSHCVWCKKPKDKDEACQSNFCSFCQKTKMKNPKNRSSSPRKLLSNYFLFKGIEPKSSSKRGKNQF